MKWRAVFVDRVFFPFWPLPVAILLGLFLSIRVHVYWWVTASNLKYVGLLLVSLRYLWAMKYGAPVIGWVIWLGAALAMEILALGFVSEVARFAR